MRSSTRRALTCALILASTPLLGGLSACASHPVAILNASPCSTLVPADWRDGVPAPALPSGSTAGDWSAYADAAVGQLDKANGRAADALTIVERCEARDAEASERLKPKPWFKRLWPG